MISNPNQRDRDRGRVGDACDNCRTRSNSNQADVDGDRVGNACDNCRYYPNPDQLSSDPSTYGSLCTTQPARFRRDQDQEQDSVDDFCTNIVDPDEVDSDSDGVGDYRDNCPLVPNLYQSDSDNDRIGDACDNCPHLFNPGQVDYDDDRIGDDCDTHVSPDNDNDTICEFLTHNGIIGATECQWIIYAGGLRVYLHTNTGT